MLDTGTHSLAYTYNNYNSESITSVHCTAVSKLRILIPWKC